MNLNYDWIIFAALAISAIVVFIDIILLAPRRKKQGKVKMPMVVDYAHSFLPVLLIVFSGRSFGGELRYIPTGSLKPTLLVGDLIFVNKFDYGIRLPIVHTKILSIGEPKRGDIVVFREPPDESRDLIKRVIGVPGDHISYRNKVLFINGKEMSQKFVRYTVDQDDESTLWNVTEKQENLFGVAHGIYQIQSTKNDDFDVVVPQGKYFMMGDNRDDSADSRCWGLLSEKNIIGKATHIFVSYNKITNPVRWERIGSKII